MRTKNLFISHLKTYKAKDMHPDCAVVKRKKLDMGIKEIENLLWTMDWSTSGARDNLERIESIFKRLRG